MPQQFPGCPGAATTFATRPESRRAAPAPSAANAGASSPRECRGTNRLRRRANAAPGKSGCPNPARGPRQGSSPACRTGTSAGSAPALRGSGRRYGAGRSADLVRSRPHRDRGDTGKPKALRLVLVHEARIGAVRERLDHQAGRRLPHLAGKIAHDPGREREKENGECQRGLYPEASQRGASHTAASSNGGKKIAVDRTRLVAPQSAPRARRRRCVRSLPPVPSRASEASKPKQNSDSLWTGRAEHARCGLMAASAPVRARPRKERNRRASRNSNATAQRPGPPGPALRGEDNCRSVQDVRPGVRTADIPAAVRVPRGGVPVGGRIQVGSIE